MDKCMYLDEIMYHLSVSNMKEGKEIIDDILGEIGEKYCLSCGNDNPTCQCENDS